MSQLSSNPLVQRDQPVDLVVSTNPWDFVVLAGTPTPGVCKVTNCPRKYRWDCKTVAGAQGQTETYQGWEAVKGIKVKIVMWTAAQIDYFYTVLVPNIQLDAVKATPSPITAVHPAMNANSINSLSIEEIGELSKDSPNGLWSVTLTFMEYRPAQNKNLSSTPANGPKNGSSAAGAPQKPDPLARKQALADRLAVMAGLPNSDLHKPPGFIGPPP